MILTVDNPDAVFAQAIHAGAIAVVSEDHGWRIGRIADPFGHHWEIGKPLD
jgi:PhnB protein